MEQCIFFRKMCSTKIAKAYLVISPKKSLKVKHKENHKQISNTKMRSKKAQKHH